MSQQLEQNDDISFEIDDNDNTFEINKLQKDSRNHKSKKSMKKALLIVIGVILLLAGFVCYMFLFQRQFVEQHLPFFVKKQPDVIIPATSVLFNNYQSLEVKNLMSEAELLARISADLNPRPAPIVLQPVPRIVTRGFIQTPTWVIVTNTFTNEVQAIRTVAQNSKKGVRRGGYFWAPDYIPGAPGNFRTYIGFFDSKEAAQQRIDNEPAIAEMFPNYTIQRLQ